MNMYQSVLKISLLSIGLLCNTTFGMKRLPDASIQTESSQNTKVQRMFVSDQDYLEKSFAFSMPSLNLTEILSKVKIPNAAIEQMPVLHKFALFNKVIAPKQKYIDEAQVKRSIILKNTMTSNDAKLWIEAEHNKIYAQLRNDKIDAHNQLLQAYNIDRDSNSWYMQEKHLQDKAAFDIESMRQPRTDTTWCPHVPAKFAQFLIDEMQETGLEPTAFDLKILHDKYLNTASASFCAPQSICISVSESITLEASKKNPTQTVFGYKKGAPACISYHPNLADKDDAYLLQTVKHEIRHALEGDDGKRKSLVGAIINHNKNVTIGQIALHPAYAQYVKTHENAADILPALKDAKTAQCIMGATNLYPDSYGALRMICTNFELLAEIQNRDQQKSNLLCL